MAKRALIIGSQTGGLLGVHSDVEVVEDALQTHGFTTTRAIEADASRDGILERYRGLVSDTTSGDAAVVYYSGHGGRERNALAGSDPTAPPWLQYLLPTDIDDRSDDTFRGLLAQELSQLQRELTEKTRNVTTILDCCHSGRMSRDGSMVPKAANHTGSFPWADVERRWAGLRAESGLTVAGRDDNPFAVRMVACSPNESAYELAYTDLGGPHGAMTSSLVPILKSALAATLTWRGVLDVIRPAVMDIVPVQRPEVEGPLSRLLFSTDTRDETGVVPVRVEGGVALLDGASLFGMAEGDTYAVVPPGGDPRQPLATAVIERVVGGRARLLLSGVDAAALPAGSSAHPMEVALGARPVAVVPPDHPDRASVVDALRRSPHVRVVDGGRQVLATVTLDGEGLRVLDAGGEPLHHTARPVGVGTLALLAADLQKLARATHVRELASGTGAAALPDDVDVSYVRLRTDGGEVELTPGDHLFTGDRVVVRFDNRADETRYVSMLDVGLSGAVSVLTASEPDGVTLQKQERYELGRDPVTGVLDGIGLFWPDVPEGGPRPETFVTVVADEKVEGLKRLEQAGVRSRQAGGPALSGLGRLIDAVDAGRRDARPAGESARPTRYRVERFDFVLHPTDRREAVEEPPFAVDQRPDPSFRLVAPRADDAPGRVAVRLADLAWGDALSAAPAVRVDAMAVTAPPHGAGSPFRTATTRLTHGAPEGAGDLVVHEGPVGRFLDLAVWVAADDGHEPDLPELLADDGSSELAAAVAVLSALGDAAVASPAQLAGSEAAVATLVRAAARHLSAGPTASVGAYRTTLLPHRRFGAAAEPGGGRHPASGVIEAGDLSFSFEVVDLDLTDDRKTNRKEHR